MVRQPTGRSVDLQVPIINIKPGRVHTHSIHSPAPPHPFSACQHPTHLRSLQHHGRRRLQIPGSSARRFPHILFPHFPTTTEYILDTVPLQLKDSIKSLFRATTQAINAGVVASTKAAGRRFWKAWTKWICINFPIHHPDLHNTTRAKQTTLMAVFAHHVPT